MKDILTELASLSAKLTKKGRGGRSYPLHFRTKAVQACQHYGTSQIAKVTGVSHVTLAKWLQQEPSKQNSAPAVEAEFCEIGILSPPHQRSASSENDRIEIIAPGGTRISFCGDGKIKLALAELFLREGKCL